MGPAVYFMLVTKIDNRPETLSCPTEKLISIADNIDSQFSTND